VQIADRKIDEAFSDRLKTPCNVIPIQDVLLVIVEQFAHQRSHAVLAIRGDTPREIERWTLH
jgi:hypothetical protein